MDPDAYRDDSGSDEPDTYWRRRAVTLAAGLAVLGLLAWAFSGGGGKPAPVARNSPEPGPPAAAYHSASASPSSSGADAAVPGLASASPSATPPSGSATANAAKSRSSQSTPTASASDPAAAANAPGPGGRCSPGAVVLSLFSSRPSYPAGQDPQFRLYTVSTASGRCTFDLGPAHLHLVVMSAGRVIWDSADCVSGGDTQAGTLSRGVPVQESIAWNRSITLPGCLTLASSARPGTYQAQARTAGVASQIRTFKLTS